MKKSELRQIIKEEIKEAVTTDHPSYSAEAKAYALASAELSNAILHLDPDDPKTAQKAEGKLHLLDRALEKYLKSYFKGNYDPRYNPYKNDPNVKPSPFKSTSVDAMAAQLDRR